MVGNIPGEIYFPDDFLGQPMDIVKDENGAVVGFDGADMQTTETYICDHCGKKFKVDAIVTFKTELSKDVFDADDDFEVEKSK